MSDADKIVKKIEEDFEEGGIADVLIPDEDRHEYTKRQRYSLILGAILFIAIVLMPVPSTFLKSAVKNSEISDNVLLEIENAGYASLENGKIVKIHDLHGLLNLIKEKDGKLYDSIVKKGRDMQIVLALALLMAVWWMGESIPLPATALLPLVILPLFNVSKITSVAPSYASKVIFLFMGGFFIASAMMKWGLHKRLALLIINAIGTSPRLVILGFMVATAFLSMWISNTATTMMMMPIALSIIIHVATIGEDMKKRGEFKNVNFTPGNFRFGTALMLGVAYAASIGGVATIIGTPPNAIFVGTFSKMFPNAPEISFTDWLAIGIPISWVFLFITWATLVFLLLPPEISEIPGGRRVVREELAKLGNWSRGEKIVLAVFAITALAWINSKPKVIGGVTIPGIKTYLPFVDDYVIAMIAAIALFLIPVDFRKGEFALDWDHAKEIPWGILLLFGGGIALSSAFTKSGLANWIAEQLLFLKGIHPLIIMLAITTLVIFLTEMTSNTAIATLMMPVMAGFAIAMGVDPRFFMIPAAIAASFAFMLPVATPPNAIVYGTGYVKVPQMARTGFLLNIIGIVFVSLLSYFILQFAFGINPAAMPAWVP
ncbi:SLC13 family permease [Geoglobus acetivorans]|uniref:Anion transporter n=1 Tax=Geoglobus acetivorans TaxID=565033 RepID=A0A0A7GCB3_GEOAI|nr:anion transporter [Geoglobus acetivorans]